MNNTYSVLYNAEGVFLAFSYLFAFVVIFWRLLNDRQFSLRERYVFLVSFILFSLSVYLFSYTSILPYFPDTIKFAELVEQGYHDSSSLGVRLYVIVSYPLRMMALEQIEVYLIFQAFFYFSSVILLWKGWLIHCQHYNIFPGKFELITVFATLYPAALAFITIPLREFIQIFGFSIFLYGLSRYIYMGKISALIIGAILTIFVRPQLIVVYPIMFLIAKRYKLWKLSLLALCLLPLAIIGFEQLLGYKFNPQFFAYLRNSANDTYEQSGMVYGRVMWDSYLDILLDLPALMLQFVLAPLPILHSISPFKLKFLLLDMMFVIFILFGSFSISFKYSHVYLKLFIVLVGIFSIWEFFIGGAVRHRFPLIFMLLPLAACYYSAFLHNLLNKGKVNE